MKRLLAIAVAALALVLYTVAGAQTLTLSGPSNVNSSQQSATFQPCCIVNGAYVPGGPFVTQKTTVWRVTSVTNPQPFTVAVAGSTVKTFCMLKIISVQGNDYKVLGYIMGPSGFVDGNYRVPATFGIYNAELPLPSPQTVAAQLLCGGEFRSPTMQVTVSP